MGTMRAGFTMIEMLIATALGLVICAAAWAGLRAATQSVAVVNRLSLENSLLRQGAIAALDDLDTWRSLDDPDDASRQTLRTGGGFPAPFAALALPAGMPIDPDHSSSRAWFRGDPVNGDAKTGGDYGLLGHSADPDPASAWRHRFLAHVVDRLGYYALIDYAPADTLFSWSGADGRPVGECWRHDQNAPGTFTSANHAWVHVPRDVIGVTRGTLYTITADPAYVANGVHRRWFGLWDFVPLAPGWRTDDAFAHCGQPIALLPLKPSAWPGLSVETRRFAMGYRRWQTATVVLASPITGAKLKLFLATTSTTLRGARLQRHAVSGWAVAAQPTLDG